MDFHKLDFKVNIRKLRKWYKKVVLPSGEATMQGNTGFGGWDILSSTGQLEPDMSDYENGRILGCFNRNFSCYREVEPGVVRFDHKQAEKVAFEEDWLQDKPTSLFKGPVVDIFNDLQKQGLIIRRARVTVLDPGGSGHWHRDTMPNQYGVRLHIPLETNEECFFCYPLPDHNSLPVNDQEERHHMKADGSVYLVNVSRLHRIINRGSTRRVHIIMNVWDTKPLSRHLGYYEDRYGPIEKSGDVEMFSDHHIDDGFRERWSRENPIQFIKNRLL